MQRRRRIRLGGALGALAAGAGIAALVVGLTAGSSARVLHVRNGPVVDVRDFRGHGRLAFVSRDRLWVLNGHGALRQIPTPAGLHPLEPVFSPDGKWLAYVETSFSPANVAGGGLLPGELWIAHADGSGAVRIRGVGDAVPLAWNPRRDLLAVTNSDGKRLWIVTPQGELRQVARDFWIQGAVWSPDGTRLAVFADRSRGPETVSVLSFRTGGKTVWLSFRQNDRLNGMGAVVLGPAGWWKGFGLGFWVFGNGAVHNSDATPLDIVRGPGARPRLLARTLSDGTTDAVAASSAGVLAVAADHGGDRVFWQYRRLEVCRPGSSCVQIVPSAAKVTVDPAWSPNGRLLAFVEAPNLSYPGWPQKLLHRWYDAHRLLVYDTVSGRTIRVAGAAGATNPVWSQDGKSLLYVAHDALWLLRNLSARPVEIATPLFPAKNWPAYYGQVAWLQQFAWSS